MKKTPQFNKAFEYVVNGYSIMPLRLNKRPQLSSWESLQTTPWTDEEVISYWTRFPKANIGIITGKISGITVVDIDIGKSSDDPTTALSTFPETYTVETPTGGYHLYYTYDERIQQTANTFPQFPHVDIRNDGGYVVAPPSFCDYVKHKVRKTGTYKLIKDIPIAAFPASLFIGAEEEKLNNKKQSKAILKNMQNMADGDGRNNALTSVAGKILTMMPETDYETIGIQMILAANAQFKEPLPKKEVLAIFSSLTKREDKKAKTTLAKALAQTGNLGVELILTDKGVPIVNEENVYRIMAVDPLLKDTIRFNIFTGMVETSYNHPADTFDTYQRADIIRIRMYLMRTYPFLSRVPHACVEDSFIRIAEENRVSPPHEWLKSLKWDGTGRLDRWITDTYGTPDDEYHRAVASNWMKGLVKRLAYPGCKFDYVLVVEGKQGIRKSTSLSVLGGDWYVETILAPDNKDFFMLFAGKAIVEFSEGETLSRTEAKRLKAIITIQNDKYRVPYERSAKEFPRQCVFAMTTNQEEYLKDETGNRRWLPIRCDTQANIDWLTENREQLYAEAYYRAIILKEPTHEFPEEETRAEQQKRQTADPREEAIYEWYFTRLNEYERGEGITTNQAYAQGIHNGIPFGREMSRFDSMVIGTIFGEVLHLEKRRMMDRGERFYKYFPTKNTEKIAPRVLTVSEQAEVMFAEHMEP